MTQHKELIERLCLLADEMDDELRPTSSSVADAAAIAIASLERENEALRLQLHEAAKNAFQAMPHDIPLRMKRKICVNAGWSGSAVSRAYTELRAEFTGEPYKANEDLDAAWSENAALRKKAERYDYLTLQHGEFCITYADTSPSVIKAEAADRLIDAAIQHEGESHGISKST